MVHEACKLCGKIRPLRKSHIIPKFVYRKIRKNSPAKYYRNPYNPNLRLQDGDKCTLLCDDCELRFSKAESEFSQTIFSPFFDEDQDEFQYGPWLHYFISSLSWRTLILELPGLCSEPAYPRSMISRLENYASTLRDYLLGDEKLGTNLSIHALCVVNVHHCPPKFATTTFYKTLRCDTRGYTLITRSGHYAVMHNLCGFICVLIIKGNRDDVLRRTKIYNRNGNIKQTQRMESAFVYDLMVDIDKDGALFRKNLSPSHYKSIQNDISKNPNAPSLRFLQSD